MSRTLSPYQPRPIGFYASRLRPDALVIFLFHGVVCRDETRLRNYTRKHVERDYFAAVLHDLRAAGQPLSMPEAAAIALSGRDYPPRSFAITFDDGFENNLSVAAPVLADLALPATFYVTSDYVQHNIMSWTDRLECALEGAAPCSLRLPWESSSRQIDGVEAGIALMEELRRRVKGDRGIDADSLIADLHRQAGLVETWQAEGPLDRKLTWDQVRRLGSCPAFTIGGHSRTHRVLSLLSPESLEAEIRDSLDALSGMAGIRTEHYSYPEGLDFCYSPDVIAALKRHGILCCPTAMDGFNTRETGLFDLRRVPVI